MQKDAALAVAMSTSGIDSSSALGSSSTPTIFACSVFLIVGGPPGGDVRLNRGLVHGDVVGAAVARSASGIPPGSGADGDSGDSDEGDTPSSVRSPAAIDSRRSNVRQGGGFGLLPIAFLDRLLECASFGNSSTNSTPVAAGSGAEHGGRWSTLRQCRITALFTAAGGGTVVPASVQNTSSESGGKTNSKRVMSSMQV